ncbi:MAG: hypothetical protein NW215_10820 [Hyphomicrobiales bacterium]|nr:hypothetical protein [Hyphomicrobiales bacterium]
MTLNVEVVTVVAGGSRYTGWTKVDINYAIKEAARSFSLETTERPGEFNFLPGTPITIFANASLVLTGYVNGYHPQGDANSHTITIKGRSKSQDVVDSSATHDTGHFEKKDAAEIGAELDKFGVGIRAKVKLPKIRYWQIAPGESVFATLERALRPAGVTMMGAADGGIDITDASVAQRHAGGLIEGVNIKEYSGDLTDQNRHSDYSIKGQARSGAGAAALRVKEDCKDGGVKRYRPKTIIHEGDCDSERAKKRGEHERNRRAGLSIKCEITTQGWRDDGGLLWEPNRLIYVHSPILLKISQDMLIEKVSLSQDSGGSGSLAKLSLVDPRAYNGKQGKTSSDKGWSHE